MEIKYKLLKGIPELARGSELTLDIKTNRLEHPMFSVSLEVAEKMSEYFEKVEEIPEWVILIDNLGTGQIGLMDTIAYNANKFHVLDIIIIKNKELNECEKNYFLHNFMIAQKNYNSNQTS